MHKDEFSDDFFKRFSLKPSSNALDLGDGILKRYSFPTLYGDVRSATAIFFCSLHAACKIMPHPSLIPVSMGHDRSLVIFSTYEYRNVYGMYPYNEIAMAIPVVLKGSLNISVLPMLINKFFPSMGYYVFKMPVTSLENQLRGNCFWGLPKVTQDIDIKADGSDFVTIAYEKGVPYFELSMPTSGKFLNIDSSANIYSVLEGTIKKSTTFFKGQYVIKNFFKTLWQKNIKPDRPYLKIYETPQTLALKNLMIEPHPFQIRFTSSMNAAFTLPKSQNVKNNT